MKIDKSRLRDTQGRPLTQALFLETDYDTSYAVYTTKDEDHEYKGVVYPSLKRLYLEMEDVIEYDFARTYLLGWRHWQRICRNKALLSMVEDWRTELELQIRSQAFKDVLDACSTEKSLQASKYLLERGWVKRGPGRPVETVKETDEALVRRIETDYASDIARFQSK